MLCAFDIEAPPLHQLRSALHAVLRRGQTGCAGRRSRLVSRNGCRKSAGPLLELMCGSGRLLVPLAAAGFKLHGVDFSARRCSRSCEARLAARAPHRAAVSPGPGATQPAVPLRRRRSSRRDRSSCITEPGAALLALQRIRAHLVDPGLLLLDMFVPSESDTAAGRAAGRSAHGASWPTARRSRCARRRPSGPTTRMSRTDYRYAHRRGADAVRRGARDADADVVSAG